MFAVVMIAGSQFKVTTEDVIVIRNAFYPSIGDKIRLEKVLLVGSSDFSVVGKPFLRFVSIIITFGMFFLKVLTFFFK
jgi:large subunit ribosomal protein L21